MHNPVTPIEYQRMYNLKERHRRWMELNHEEVGLLFELLERMWEAIDLHVCE